MFFVPLYPLFGLNNACTVCSRLYELVIGRDILATKVGIASCIYIPKKDDYNWTVG